MVIRHIGPAAMMLAIGLGLAACAPGTVPRGGTSDAAGTALPDKEGPQIRQGGRS